jgi:hypothetical protein
MNAYIAYEATPGSWTVKPVHGHRAVETGLTEQAAQSLVGRKNREFNQPRRFKR